MTNHRDSGGKPLQFVKVISWSLFAIILGFSLLLSVFISKYAEQTLLDKQEKFGLLLAENVSHQVFTRFVMPTVMRYGGISLRQEEQFKTLDQVVRSTVHSFHVTSLRIYDPEGVITYSLNKDEVGENGSALYMVTRTWETARFTPEILAKVSKFASLFRVSLKPGSLTLRAYYPLRAERSLTDISENPIMGILEFTQDITPDFMAMLNFERLVIAFSLVTSMVLFFLVLAVLRRAERLSNAQLREKEQLIFELQQQEKLAGMGRMVAGVAHEIRNPLGIICSSAELILKKAVNEQSPHTRILQALHEEAKRLTRTVGEFLDYARPKKPTMADVNVGRLLDQVAVFMEPECEKLGVTIDREYSGDLSAKGDKDLLYRAFYNLIANALQAMDKGGQVFLRAAREEGRLHVTVQDTGPGFAPEHIEKVRDPFFTTKDTGTGLGLALVSAILESHGVEMHLSNADDGGARVDIIFPAV
ncbi:MAG: two-component sensor histidine kinase [Pseudodesulfovibrio sp.]|uniref:histidine kinase n=1 Tax=Pseudodesulfovibrio aespoeensis (strain ATCC 700646 / DSM 10631 / Aspo-2) TaxID=643562 RepID=E6VVW0_PSEA9|nr:ATP-binding region ATPase domain protein [Pseudodesulfovibrio aespoeensis Aspo-2]MBU4190887.1 two-component sensor histidine kinase [Pseudomonadota bacterium]MBV1765611.1 two-component sensor histidine kinase [Pseudodesulfovibrio sp.]MBU4243976.1 two-component sensor histidine kinase [Pseudomonadota bacterium]MBU4378338.1 two-component sensor histidine kinase [Pseudomonadota bacterium]